MYAIRSYYDLDAHSAYMDTKEYKDLNVQTKGEFGGLGISIGMKVV